VLTGTIPDGKMTVWVDPAKGWLFRKALIEKRFVPPLPRGQTKILWEKTEVGAVEISEIAGRCAVTKATMTVTSERENGKKGKGVQEGKLLNLQWNPPFDQLGAFQMDLPEGTKLRNVDLGVDFVWRKGKAELDLDPAVEKQIISLAPRLRDKGASEGNSAALAGGEKVGGTAAANRDTGNVNKPEGIATVRRRAAIACLAGLGVCGLFLALGVAQRRHRRTH
jgi:hypothetical protein